MCLCMSVCIHINVFHNHLFFLSFILITTSCLQSIQTWEINKYLSFLIMMLLDYDLSFDVRKASTFNEQKALKWLRKYINRIVKKNNEMEKFIVSGMFFCIENFMECS